jgi:hypothetical protein
MIVASASKCRAMAVRHFYKERSKKQENPKLRQGLGQSARGKWPPTLRNAQFLQQQQ